VRRERKKSSPPAPCPPFPILLAATILLTSLLASGAAAAPALRAEHLVSIPCRGGEYFDFTPLGLAFDAAGKLFIVDADNSRVMVMKDSFEDMRPFSDVFRDSVGINFVDVDIRDGLTVYVSEENRGVLIGFDRIGQPRAVVDVGQGVAGFGIGSGGKTCAANATYEVVRIVYIDGDRETADVTLPPEEGHVLYVDCLVMGEGKFVATAASHGRLLHFNAVGRYLGPFGRHEFEQPYGIASLAGEYVLVTDVGRKEIVVLDAAGNPVGSFGGKHLDEPTFLAVRRDGTVCVSDTRRRTIEVFKIEID
jgi:DNA-binding beta-propeller fold protein YncE